VSHSDPEFVLLHNPGCSKSRSAKALLEEHAVAFRERRYLEDPLARGELEELAGRLGCSPRQWIRNKEAAFQEAGLDASSDEDAILDAMVAHPILMERPILVRGARAVVGRPPEKLLELLEPVS
jgi:arsenate reductase